jgi:tellurite resistance protein TehA-like permease
VLILAALGLVGVLVFQAWVTRRVWKNPFWERSEKVAQIRLVWLLPLVGAAIVHSFQQDEDQARRTSSGEHRR